MKTKHRQSVEKSKDSTKAKHREKIPKKDKEMTNESKDQTKCKQQSKDIKNSKADTMAYKLKTNK